MSTGSIAEFDVVGDLVSRERRSERLALHAAELDRTYSYFDLCNTACKAGNVLRHLGVREGDRVAVDPRPLPESVLTFLGAALLGAVTELAADISPESDARAVVVPAERESEFDLPGGSKLCVYGGKPDRPDTTHWETEVWSENPAFPPTTHNSVAPVLRGSVGAANDSGTARETGGADDAGETGHAGSTPDTDEPVDDLEAFSHAAMLAAAGEAGSALGLTVDSRIAVRAPLSDPRTVAAGVLAPLAVGATIGLPDGDVPLDWDASADATSAIVCEERVVPEDRTLALDSVSIPSP